MQLTPQAITILEKRYYSKSEKRLDRNPEDVLLRTARHIAGENEEAFIEYFNFMDSLKFLPNSPTLMNAGTGNRGSLSACFVLPVEDSMEGITKASHDMAMVQKFGGGTGLSLSGIRPKGSPINSTHGVACGPVAVLRYLSATSTLVTQGGKRDGANMAVLRVDHPDILEFIHCKDDGKGIHNFNISVGLIKSFLDARDACNGKVGVGCEGCFGLTFGGKAYDLICAAVLWKELVESAHLTGDPGLLFLDEINASRANPLRGREIEATNPCGEQPLYPGESCNLGSLNLSKFVLEWSDGKNEVDWRALEKAARLMTRFLDDVVEVNTFPDSVPLLAQMNKDTRRIGGGVMGWHDLLLKLRIPYDSDQAVILGEAVMKCISEAADDETRKMGVERGDFRLIGESIYERPRRNITTTTIAPTGTISLIAGCSSGIEPVFAWSYRHNGLEGRIKDDIVHPIYAQAKEEGWYTPELFKSAQDIDPIWHLKHQAAFQKWTDNAVSKTINLRSDATVSDVDFIYREAYNLGCKGVTIYRDGSKGGQVLVATKKDAGRNNSDNVDGVGERANYAQVLQTNSRPGDLPSRTYRRSTPHGTLWITITEKDGAPYEVFLSIGKAGSDIQGMTEAMGRLLSVSLQHSNNPSAFLNLIVEQWEGIGGQTSVGFGPEKVRSIADAVAKVIRGYGVGNLGDAVGASTSSYPDNGVSWVYADSSPTIHADICPECGEVALVHSEGCAKCSLCGFSQC